MSHLRSTDWNEFERKFPAAQAWLTARNLERETADLETEADSLRSLRDRFGLDYIQSCRLTWVEKRLGELTAWKLDALAPAAAAS